MRVRKNLFDDFWESYGLKRNRKGAEDVWKKLSQKDRYAALQGIAAYRDDCQMHGTIMMHPRNYLYYRRWEDERESAAIAAPPASDTMDFTKMDIW